MTVGMSSACVNPALYIVTKRNIYFETREPAVKNKSNILSVVPLKQFQTLCHAEIIYKHGESINSKITFVS